MTFWFIEIALARVALSSPSPFDSCSRTAPRESAIAEQVGREGAMASGGWKHISDSEELQSKKIRIWALIQQSN